MAKGTRPKAKRTTASLPAGESKLSTNIPIVVHRKLKAVAALRGISIRELLIEYANSLTFEGADKRKR